VTADAAIFRPDGPGRFVPTEAATGAWDARLVHGAAIVGLLAGQLAPPADRTLARLTLEILAPVPMGPLTVEVTEPAGGARVQRQDATLSAGDKVVATARSLLVRRADPDLALPDKALDHPSPFDPAAAPAMDEPHREAAAMVGHESLDSLGFTWVPMRVEGDKRTHQWVSLLLPVVEGTELKGIELAAVAADYAQSAVNRQLSLRDWSFRSVDMTLNLTREPAGPWIGMRCEGLVQPVGAGFNGADLFDRDGRLGRTSASIVVEPRQHG